MLFKNLRRRRLEKRRSLLHVDDSVIHLSEAETVLAPWPSGLTARVPTATNATVAADPDEDDVYDDSDLEFLSDVSPRDVDKEFALLVTGILTQFDQPTTPGALRNVQLVGQLRDGGWAWVCLGTPAWGQVNLSKLEYDNPQPGDAFRARVRSYGLLHFIDAVDRNSLVRSGETRRPRTELSEGTIPESVRGTWRAELRPGDIVVARIPFGPLAGVDGGGNTSKIRPAIFVGWTEDEAAVRRISRVGGYLERNGGIRLRWTQHLKKESVVSPTNQYVAFDDISKRVARIHPTDAGTARIPISSVAALLPTVEARELPRSNRSALPNSSTLIVDIIRKMEQRAPTHDGDRLANLLRVLAETETRILLATLGELESDVGAYLCWPRPNGKLISRVSRAIKSGRIDAHITFDDNRHPLVIFDKSARLNEPTSGSYVYPVAPHDYATPDIVILDQLSCHLMLQERRTDLSETRSILQNGSDAPTFLVGSSDNGSLRSFQTAARLRGWTVVTTTDRDETLRAVVELVRQRHAGFVTIVTDRADIVAAIEAYGCEVAIIDDWE